MKKCLKTDLYVEAMFFKTSSVCFNQFTTVFLSVFYDARVSSSLGLWARTTRLQLLLLPIRWLTVSLLRIA